MDITINVSIIIVTSIVIAGVHFLERIEKKKYNVFIIITLFSYLILLFARLPIFWLSNSIVILASIAGSILIGGLNRDESSLVVFLITAAIIDYFSFSGGLTSWIIDNARSDNTLILQYLTIALPIESGTRFLIGIGDLFITGAISLTLSRLKYPIWGTYVVLLFSLLLAVNIGLILGGIPALPIISIAIILYVSIRRRSIPIKIK